METTWYIDSETTREIQRTDPETFVFNSRHTDGSRVWFGCSAKIAPGPFGSAKVTFTPPPHHPAEYAHARAEAHRLAAHVFDQVGDTALYADADSDDYNVTITYATCIVAGPESTRLVASFFGAEAEQHLR